MPDGLAAQADDAFTAAFGHHPDGVWSAPGRINLIGEHTDYNDGFVLPMAIGRRTCVALGRRVDGRARIASAAARDTVTIPLDEVAPGAVGGWSAYALGSAWGLRRELDEPGRLGGFDAYVVSDVPLGAGLSSSAALECALAVGLRDLWGIDVDGEALLRATHAAENDVVGAPTGILDQSASLFCEAGQALFIDCRDRTREQVPLDLAAAGLRVLVVDTRVAHAHSEGGYAERRTSCERAAAALGLRSLREITEQQLADEASRLDDVAVRRARHVVTENARVLRTVSLLRSSGPRAIGEQLIASHASLRDDFEVSTPELDAAVDVALGAGALGARMTGGGFGGSAIALVERDAVGAVAAAVRRAFAERAFADPDVFAVDPGEGARRDRG